MYRIPDVPSTPSSETKLKECIKIAMVQMDGGEWARNLTVVDDKVGPFQIWIYKVKIPVEILLNTVQFHMLPMSWLNATIAHRSNIYRKDLYSANDFASVLYNATIYGDAYVWPDPLSKATMNQLYTKIHNKFKAEYKKVEGTTDHIVFK